MNTKKKPQDIPVDSRLLSGIHKDAIPDIPLDEPATDADPDIIPDEEKEDDVPYVPPQPGEGP